ncbi:MAG: hypothetical protein IPI73_03900 [Betaproteobacteria bacterium]|nr:hypothetical protein [Betaproteobacteria bacterium]
MAQEGAFLVPTLATSDSLYRNGARLGGASDDGEAGLVRGQCVDAIRMGAPPSGKIGYGTDLFGEMHADQSLVSRRTPAMPAAEILRSATAVNAELLWPGRRARRHRPCAPPPTCSSSTAIRLRTRHRCGTGPTTCR